MGINTEDQDNRMLTCNIKHDRNVYARNKKKVHHNVIQEHMAEDLNKYFGSVFV